MVWTVYMLSNAHRFLSECVWIYEMTLVLSFLQTIFHTSVWTVYSVTGQSWGSMSLSSYCTFSAWASSDFKLLVTFFNSSSRSPDLLSDVRKRKSKRRKSRDLKGRTAEEVKPRHCLKERSNIFINIFLSVLLRNRRWISTMKLICLYLTLSKTENKGF